MFGPVPSPSSLKLTNILGVYVKCKFYKKFLIVKEMNLYLEPYYNETNSLIVYFTKTKF